MISIQSAKAICESIDLNSGFFDEDDEEYTMLRDQNHQLWVAYGELYELAYSEYIEEGK